MPPEQLNVQFLQFVGPLAGVVVLSMILERALSFVFDYHWFKVWTQTTHGIKALLTLIASYLVCAEWNVDLMQRLFAPPEFRDKPTFTGVVITALVVAGGSSGTMSLFEKFMGFHKSTRDELIAAEKAAAEAKKLAAQVELEAQKKAAKSAGVSP